MGLFQQPAISWAVELHCPQCAAPVTLEEADRIFNCAYCRIRLLMIHPGRPQYYLDPYLENKDRTVPEMLYFPYWRIRGMSFPCLQSLKKERVVDATFLAAQIPGLPPYLGLQTRAFKLRFLSSAKKGRFHQPQFPLEGFFSELTGEEDALSNPQDFEGSQLFQQALIGETISQVYAPFYIQTGTLFDGLGDLSLGNVRESDFESVPTLGPEGFQQVRFLPVMCPYCGADLQGEKDTQVLLCRNCDRVWDYSRDELKQIDFKVLKDSGEKSQTYYLPFWRIRARISGWPGQIPRPLSRPLLDNQQSIEGDSPGGDLYWLPAFKLSPTLFLTVSKAASFRHPQAPIYLDTLPQGQYYPVTLAWDQAAEGLYAVIADFIKSRPLSRLSPIKIEPTDHLLIYVPFHLQGNELVHQEMRLGISRTSLHFGRFL